MVAAAVGATVVAGVASSAMSANQAGKANASQQQAAQNQLQLAQQQYDTMQSQIQPYLSYGNTGLQDYGDLIGTNGADAQSAAIGGIKNGPQYQGDMQTANENILANASATGGLRGSNTSNILANTSISTLNGLITQRLAGYGQLMNNGLNSVSASQAASNVFQNNSNQATQNSANANSQYDAALSNSFKSGLGSITQGFNAFAGGGMT
jgi:type II secretory pathway pseudopilin PulG